MLAAAKDAGIAAGILAGDQRQALAYTALGFRFVGVGSDASLLARAASDAVRHLRGPGAEQPEDAGRHLRGPGAGPA